MRKALSVVILLGSMWFVFSVFPKAGDGLAGFIALFVAFIGLLIAIPTTLVVGAVEWRKTSHWWMMPSLVCFAFLWTPRIAPYIREPIEDWELKSHLSEYDKVVDDVRKGTIVTATSLTWIDLKQIESLPPGVIAIWAARDSRAVTAKFLISHGGRIGNGYIYAEDNKTAEAGMVGASHYYLRHIVGNWFHFTDE
jgi:hypothetical protein